MRVVVYGFVAAFLALCSTPAAATCGPNLETYLSARTGVEGSGVRCVAFLEHSDVNFGMIWYGEGVASGRTYRHLGAAISCTFPMFCPRDLSLDYAQYDIAANGEGYDNIVETQFALDDIVFAKGGGSRTLASISRDDMPPDLIIFEPDSDQPLIWRRVPPGERSGYVSPLRPLDRCGSHLRETFVYAPDGRPRNGVRCSLPVTRDGFPPAIREYFSYFADYGRPGVWIGAGEANGRRYLNLTYRKSGLSDWSITDICLDRSWWCNHWPGAFTIRPPSPPDDAFSDGTPISPAFEGRYYYVVDGPLKVIWSRPDD